ncbi:unnamed protein product [Orchesella dallaii]|uniref:small monomeric GTPase n=1 Tax=Orchesella dallaii TaxID=48710 RepID=A0ABP1RXX2_9HEXA
MAASSTALTGQDADAEINIILVGESGVGKTALLDQFWGPYSKDTAKAAIRYLSPHVEMMIVGNKSDLVEQRVVSKERGEELKCQLDALAFRETSTVTFNQEPFLWLCMYIHSKRKLRIQGLIEKQRKEEQEKSNEKTQS